MLNYVSCMYLHIKLDAKVQVDHNVAPGPGCIYLSNSGVVRHQLIELPLPVLDISIDSCQDPIAAQRRGDLVLGHVDVRDQLLIEQVFTLQIS